MKAAAGDEKLWRYLPRGSLLHALDDGATKAACGLKTDAPESWRGTGTQDEYERVELLPKCPRCLRALRRQ